MSRLNLSELSGPSAEMKKDIVYLSVAGFLYGDNFAFTVFAIIVVGISSLIFKQEAYCNLGIIVPVRDNISAFIHMVQVFDKSVIQLFNDVKVE